MWADEVGNNVAGIKTMEFRCQEDRDLDLKFLKQIIRSVAPHNHVKELFSFIQPKHSHVVFLVDGNAMHPSSTALFLLVEEDDLQATEE